MWPLTVLRALQETQGVTVATVGAKEFPAFFTAHSGCSSPLTIDSAQDAARLIRRLSMYTH